MDPQGAQQFSQFMQMAIAILKENLQNYERQFKEYGRRDKIVAQSQVAQIISKMTRITGKNTKNYDVLRQLEQASDHLVKENNFLNQQIQVLQKEVKTNNLLSNPKTSKQRLIFEDTENCSASLYRTQHPQNKRTKTVIEKQQVSSHFEVPLHERNCSEKKPNDYSPLESSVVNEIQSENYFPSKLSPKFNSNEKSIKQLQANLKKAETFIAKNNEEFTVEIQIYNEKIWQLQQKARIQQQQIMLLQLKVKQSEYLLDKLRKDNVRLQGINRNVKQYFDVQEAQQKDIRVYNSRRNQINQMKNSMNCSNIDEKARLRHFLRANVSRSFVGSSSLSKKR